MWQSCSAWNLISRCFFARLILLLWRWRQYDPWKVGWLSTDYTTLYPDVRTSNPTQVFMVVVCWCWFCSLNFSPCDYGHCYWRFGGKPSLHLQDINEWDGCMLVIGSTEEREGRGGSGAYSGPVGTLYRKQLSRGLKITFRAVWKVGFCWSRPVMTAERRKLSDDLEKALLT